MIPIIRKIAVLPAVFYALQVLAVHVAACFPTKSLTLPVADGKEVTVESFFFGADYRRR